MLRRRFPHFADLGSASVAVLRQACTGAALYRLGRWDEAVAETDAGLSVATDTSLQIGNGWLFGVRVFITLHRGDPLGAASALSESDPGL